MSYKNLRKHTMKLADEVLSFLKSANIDRTNTAIYVKCLRHEWAVWQMEQYGKETEILVGHLLGLDELEGLREQIVPENQRLNDDLSSEFTSKAVDATITATLHNEYIDLAELLHKELESQELSERVCE